MLMGLLKDESAMSWDKILLIKDELKRRGVEQFVKVYKMFKDKKVKNKWGYELELMLCAFEENNAKLMLCGEKLVEKLSNLNMNALPEFSSFMLEITPKEAYDDDLMDFCVVEYFLQKSLNTVKNGMQCFNKNSFPLGISTFPRFGVGNSFISKKPEAKICLCEIDSGRKKDLCMCQLHKKMVESGENKIESRNTDNHKGMSFESITFDNDLEDNIICMKRCNYMDYNFWDRGLNLKYEETNSLTFPDNAITDHSRFFSFTKNFINRRGKNIEGYIKIFQDKNTEKTKFKENDSLLIDSFGLGMGCCCLQVTIQPKSYMEAKFIYDQMAIVSALILRLTRATPFFNGFLTQTETRWDLLTYATDDRTDEERGVEYNKTGCEFNEGKIPKPRYSSIDLFISDHPALLEEYNDINVPKNEECLNILLKNRIEEKVANHISSLFIRDPMMVYEDSYENLILSKNKKSTKKINIEAEKELENKSDKEIINNHENASEKIHNNEGESLDLDDFLNIQSSNWRSVRFKQPSEKENDGWKIEVRTMEVQITPFEVTAFSIFTYLLSAAIIHHKINLYIPISLVDENIKRANIHNRKKEEYFKKLEKDNMKFYYRKNITDNNKAIIEEGTLDDIFNGTKNYIGLITYVKEYIDEKYKKSAKLHEYIDFISKKAKGEYLSISEYFRKFIFTHKDYKDDSKITEKIGNEIIKNIKDYTENNDYSYLKN
ncbi:gamma-glutamylcysteine synthetase [Spraguea lophii 42_110]|uniref:Glutamate--cysteine ligase n=1 Tax=Spraguea lophii (strain 42_110) TaxID=1358809 RepID=S7XJC1_SPRLO|nr:gamma-glutamylcysteine synthetase [Spraguea lophii 42_110]